MNGAEEVVAQDARIHPDYQRVGLMTLLDSIALHMLKAVYPKAKYVWALVTNNKAYQSVIDNPSLRPSWTFLDRRVSICQHCSPL